MSRVHEFRVLEGDEGIRPAGPQDRCLYCQASIGELHTEDCVTIDRKSTYAVLVGDVRVGTFVRDDPAGWSNEECERHKNESSWCLDNVEGAGYSGDPLPEVSGCLCYVIRLVLVERSSEARQRPPKSPDQMAAERAAIADIQRRL